MSRLIVHNFGAIKNATIEIRKYNFFIGHTSSGKSTLAKLLTIFSNASFWTIKEGDFNKFSQMLEKYNINFEFGPDTFIEYTSDKYIWEITSNNFHTNYEDADLLEMADNVDSYEFILKFIEKKEGNKAFVNLIDSLKNIINNSNSLKSGDSYVINTIKVLLKDFIYEECIPVYIPAERLLITTFSNSIFSLLQAGASIPDCIKDFGSLYEKARSQYKNIDIDILNINVSFDKQGDKIYLMDEGKELQLSQASSGIQSIIPLWIVFNQFVESKKKQMLVIEEPELNLFPSTQRFLIDWIMKKMRKSNGSIVITTHSPYVLSVVDNLILAQEILRKSADKKLAVSKIREIIPSMALVDFNEVSSYFFNSNGIVKDIKDTDIKSLGAEYIDEASNELGYIFDELCNIERDEL